MKNLSNTIHNATGRLGGAYKQMNCSRSLCYNPPGKSTRMVIVRIKTKKKETKNSLTIWSKVGLIVVLVAAVCPQKTKKKKKTKTKKNQKECISKHVSLLLL